MARKNRDVSRITPNSRHNEANRLETSKKTKLKPSSARWLKRQAKDLYVQSAKREGYRSRAAYKLIELDDKFKFCGFHGVIYTLWYELMVRERSKYLKNIFVMQKTFKTMRNRQISNRRYCYILCFLSNSI